MGLVYVTLGLAVLALWLAHAVGSALLRASERHQAVAVRESVARSLGGGVQREGMLGPREMRFSAAGRAARYLFSGEREPSFTGVEVDLRGESPGVLKIASEAWASLLDRMGGGRDIEIGDPEFDSRYLIRSTPESLAGAFFSPGRRDRAIAAVRRLGRLGIPRIDLSRERLRMGVESRLEAEGALRDLGRTASDLAELLAEIGQESGAARAEEADRADGIGQCQVCGGGMEEGVVLCSDCRTPHHRECWSYAGGCSTYACGGRRAVRD